MCDHTPNRESAMVIIDTGTPERHGRDGVWCDPCLEPLVRALNDGGVRTVSSCCGHKTHHGGIALADGRWLIILPDQATFEAFDNRTQPAPRTVTEWGVWCEETGSVQDEIADLDDAQRVIEHHNQSCPGPHVAVTRAATDWTEVTDD